ncbi:MAG: hypothetical protein II412_08605 [Clostridia bacterium]|nr:hypothetical protein [Clostridia bacterium]
MDGIIKAVLTLAAYGMVLALCEQALPPSGVKKAAKAAMGLLFLRMLTEQIAGILR